MSKRYVAKINDGASTSTHRKPKSKKARKQNKAAVEQKRPIWQQMANEEYLGQTATYTRATGMFR